MKKFLFFLLILHTTLPTQAKGTSPLLVQENDKLQFDFQYRGRFDIYDGVNKAAYGDNSIAFNGNVRGESDDTVYMQRMIAGVTYKPSDEWKLKASIYDARSWGSSLGVNDFTKNSGTSDAYLMSFYDDYHELFETYVRKQNFLHENLTLTLGRQQIGYGDGRIFDLGNWVNSIGWLWDAAHFSYKEEKNFVDIWYGQTRTKDPHDFSLFHKHRFQGVGFYAHYEMPKMKIEPFMTWRNNLHHEVKSSDNLYYAGFRVYDDEPRFIYDATYVKEMGEVNGLEVDAYAYIVKVGYDFDDRYKTKFKVGYLYASGDEDPNDAKMQTFTTPYGANDGHYYGHMDIIFWANMKDLQASFSLMPTNRLYLEAAFHHFNLVEANDKWQFFGYQNKPGNSHTHVGDEVDLVAKYKVTSSLDILAKYSYLKVGDFIVKNDIANHDASKTFLQFMYKW